MPTLSAFLLVFAFWGHPMKPSQSKRLPRGMPPGACLTCGLSKVLELACLDIVAFGAPIRP